MLEFLTQDIGDQKVFLYPRVDAVQERRYHHETIYKIGIEALSLKCGVSSSLYKYLSPTQTGIGWNIGFLGMITLNIEHRGQKLHYRIDYCFPKCFIWWVAQVLLQDKG